MGRREGDRASDAQRKAERELVQLIALRPLPVNRLVERQVLYSVAFLIVAMGGGDWPHSCFVALSVLLALISTHAQTPPLVSILPALALAACELAATKCAARGAIMRTSGLSAWIIPLWGIVAHGVADLQRISLRADRELTGVLRRPLAQSQSFAHSFPPPPPPMSKETSPMTKDCVGKSCEANV